MPKWYWMDQDGCWYCKNKNNCNQCKFNRKYIKEYGGKKFKGRHPNKDKGKDKII